MEDLLQKLDTRQEIFAVSLQRTKPEITKRNLMRVKSTKNSNLDLLLLQLQGDFSPAGSKVSLLQGCQAIGGKRLETLLADVVVGRVVPGGRGLDVAPSHHRVVDHGAPLLGVDQLLHLVK